MSAVSQFARFSAVGGIATGIQYAVLVLLVQTGIADAVSASSAGFVLSALANYALNRRFTFRSLQPHADALPRFVLVATAGLVINAALVWCFHVAVALHYLAAQVLATLGTLVWNFALNRAWTFPVSSAPRHTP